MTEVQVKEKTTYLEPKAWANQREDGYDITVELPGIAKEHIEVKTEQDTVTVSTNKTFEPKPYAIQEFELGNYKLQFSVPRDIDLNQIAVRHEFGTLKITLNRKAESLPKSIQITSQEE